MDKILEVSLTPPYIWQPTSAQIRRANVTGFMQRHEIANYDDLILRTTSGIEWFWDSSVHETKISWFEPYTEVLDASRGIADTRWFLGGRLNIAYNCLDRHVGKKNSASRIAFHWQGECGAVKSVTYEELFRQTNRLANYLKKIGIKPGDAIALYMPMIPELMVAFFAILKIGAVVVPIFSGFGTDAVTARFNHAKVKVVITADGTLRKGKEIPLKAMLSESLKKTPSLKKCIVVQRLCLKKIPMTSGCDIFYENAVSNQSEDCQSAELESEAPSLVIYTSGTTGKPKGTVHTHAGVLAQVTKEFYFHFDMKPKDVFFWVTDIGWMMGPWEIIGTTHFNNTLVIIEGAPNFPDADRVLKVSRKFRVTHLGVSPTLIRLLMREDLRRFTRQKLTSLRMLGSTGEPWDLDSYRWCFEKIGKGKVPIINISGGTELMGCLLAPIPIHPIKACSLQGPGLGMAVDVYTEGGYSAKPGEVGYLVCKKPAPSMTKGFLNDHERYLETYFSKFPNVWNHGDWAVKDQDGQWFLRGRADDTIKVAGKRVGPAEIESCLCDHPLVSEACAIGVPDELKGETVVTFVVLQNGIGGTLFLQNDLKTWAGDRLGKTLAPKQVYFVQVLPKTRSGKIVRGAIKRKYLGQDLKDLSSLENPDFLDEIPTG